MPSVADLVDEETVRRLAGPEAHARGTTLADEGHVRIGEFGPLLVSASVDDERPHDVELRAAGATLTYTCTCDEAAGGAFCAHCAATAIVTRRRSPNRA